MKSVWPARSRSRKFSRLFEDREPNQVKRSLPICVQKPVLALCRAPVSSTDTHGTMIRDEDLVHVWPLQHRHITPNGVYFANRTMPAFVLPDPVEA